MRTFVAFSVPDDAVAQIVQWQQDNLPPGVFPEPASNLHMTLAFLGETPDELVPQINQILARLDPGSVSITGPVEYREQDKLAFLVYQEQGGSDVWAQLNAELKTLTGYEPQFQPWLPHTTIWRYAPDHKPNINPPLPSISFTPSAVTLYQSVKNPAGGANYVKVGAGMGYQEVWRYRVPFRAWHDGYIMGYPGDDHEDIDDEGFEHKPFSYGGNEQGHVIFHPEYGEITALPADPKTGKSPEWLTREYVEQLKNDARGRFEEYGPYRDQWDEDPHEATYVKKANIFDPIEKKLDQRVFNGIKPRPDIVAFIEDKFYRTMDELYMDNAEQYFDLALTGSLTTFQYSDTSDCDISVFVHYDDLSDATEQDPGDIRRDLIHIVTTELDGSPLPGSGHPLQFFIIPPGQTLGNYFAPGIRSGWSFNAKGWIVPPEKARAHDVGAEMPELYHRAQMMADKLTTLLDAHDEEGARAMFAQIHKKRNEDEANHLGDFSEGNIVYKYLLHEGLFDRLRNEADVHIASTEKYAAPEVSVTRISPEHKVPILYDFDRDRIIMSNNYDFHRGSRIIGEYDGKDAYLHGASKQWINPNYFKRLWVATFPERPLNKVHMDGAAIETRPADAMTYTQKLPFLVHNSRTAKSPWKKGDKWKDYIKNEGIIVDFRIGDENDDPVEGKVIEIDRDSIQIELPNAERRTFDNDFLHQIKFRVRDEKKSLSSWKEARVNTGDCSYPDCDYEFSPDDRKDISLAHGWFHCPQCNRTYNVKNTLDEKTSAFADASEGETEDGLLHFRVPVLIRGNYFDVGTPMDHHWNVWENNDENSKYHFGDFYQGDVNFLVDPSGAIDSVAVLGRIPDNLKATVKQRAIEELKEYISHAS